MVVGELAMKVRLISKDPELFRVCREILPKEHALGWNSYNEQAGDAPSPDELMIWDVPPGGVIPDEATARPLWNSLFLIDHNDVDAFREAHGRTYVNVVLKPVGRATLSAFLNEVLEVGRKRQPSHCDSPGRSDCDQMLQCLIQANLRLQEYEQGHWNFLARTVHDFRAPLAAITGYSGLLLGEMLGPLTKDQKEVVERIQQSGQRLSRMSTAIYQLSLGRRGQYCANYQRADIRECLEQALDEMTPVIREKGITIEAELQATPEDLLFEPAHIEQVLLSLLDNACKFTPRYGRINIQGRPYFWERRQTRRQSSNAAHERRAQDRRLVNSFRIDIQDNGPAIPPERLGRMFEEGASYSGTEDRAGGGLGLAISKLIIDRHRGAIWSENTPAGAAFSFVMPMGLMSGDVECGALQAGAAAGKD